MQTLPPTSTPAKPQLRPTRSVDPNVLMRQRRATATALDRNTQLVTM